MSRAFVKEDVDPPERSRRQRTASGLPPGAANYITASGAGRLRDELLRLRRAPSGDAARVAALEHLLASATIIEPPGDAASIAFGAAVTVRDAAGQLAKYRIVGVDEVELYPDAVSWISPIGRALLAAEVGDRVTLENDERVHVVGVEYPGD